MKRNTKLLKSKLKRPTTDTSEVTTDTTTEESSSSPALQEGAPQHQEPGKPQHAGHRRLLFGCKADSAGLRKGLFLEHLINHP